MLLQMKKKNIYIYILNCLVNRCYYIPEIDQYSKQFTAIPPVVSITDVSSSTAAKLLSLLEHPYKDKQLIT